MQAWQSRFTPERFFALPNVHASLATVAAQAAECLGTNPAEAERLARLIVARAPSDPRALLILASARRRQGALNDALALLEPLARAYPNAAHTRYELGLVLAARGETEAAIGHLRRAAKLKPDLSECWRALGDLLFGRGDAQGAEAAYAECARARVTDPRLKPAADAIFEGRLDAAADALRRHLATAPDHADALHMLADIYVRDDRLADAEILLGRALALDPDFSAARFSLARALIHQQKAVEALPHIQRLHDANPADPAYRNLLAACLGLVGDTTAANAIHEGLIRDYPGHPRIWLNFGHALRASARGAEAAEAYRRALALAPDLGDAYWSLANLKTLRLETAEIDAIRLQLRQPGLADEDRVHLHYALGKVLEDDRQYRESFEHYAAGAATRRTLLRYDADRTTGLMQQAKRLFDAAWFEGHAGAGTASDAPIFILGLPRSGSTLVEQILASHSAVEGTMELPDMGFIAQSLGWGSDGFERSVAALDASGFRALGDHYLETTRVHRRSGRPHFIDKMPNNFHHIGLIASILPNARIIDTRRHPMASCFSAFKQHFAQGQSFSYDLRELGLYYRDYVELMDHFDAVLPGRIHRVVYEEMIEDTEAAVRALLDHCKLPFEEGCLRFHENARAVRTVSSEQVRRPIYRDGLEQWRNFEPWLGPLEAALGSAVPPAP